MFQTLRHVGKKPQSNALLRTTLRYLLLRRMVEATTATAAALAAPALAPGSAASAVPISAAGAGADITASAWRTTCLFLC